MAVMAFQWP